jgi:transcriptional regulator with XRE-family HTH domain
LTVREKSSKLVMGREGLKMNIGKRLRELRKKQAMTLLDLSKKSGVALATLSRIETGKRTGTLEGHMRIAKVFGMTLPEFYSELDRPVIVRTKGEKADVFIQDKKTSSAILTKDIFNKKMLPVLITLEPSGQTKPEQLKTGSERFIYVFKGKIEVLIGNDKNPLEEGTALYFDASESHYSRNTANTPAEYICVTTPTAL